jgi:L-seryl-tRNA(Ser) seleniumtransferase
MRKSGAKMVEVGTTNKTHLRDYESAIGPEHGTAFKVHTSNFQVVGFTQEVSMSELSALGKEHGIPVMEDLGSGCLLDFSEYGMIHEPTVQEALETRRWRGHFLGRQASGRAPGGHHFRPRRTGEGHS